MVCGLTREPRDDGLFVISLGKGTRLVIPGIKPRKEKKMHLFLFFISGQKEGSLGLVGE